MTNTKIKQILLKLFILLVLAAVIYFVLPASLPLIIALLTAVILEPLLRWTMRTLRVKRQLAVLIVFILFIALFGALGSMLILKGMSNLVHFAENIPRYTNMLIRQWDEWNNQIISASSDLPPALVQEIKLQMDGLLNSISEPLRNFNYMNLVKSIATGIPLILVSLLVYLIALFLFMLELPRLNQMFYSHLKPETEEKVRFMFARLGGVFSGFFKAQFLVSLIIFAVSFIGLLIITPKVALLMSLIIWFIDFVPLIGSIVILAPWALIELIQGRLFEGIGLLILAGILLIIRRTVEPKMMGQYIGLSPLSTLISMFLGAKFLALWASLSVPCYGLLTAQPKNRG